MTSDEAMQKARDGLTAAQLAQFKMSRQEWVGVVDYLAGIGIYPDDDPRSKLPPSPRTISALLTIDELEKQNDAKIPIQTGGAPPICSTGAGRS